jgi:hypothetical protein
MTTLSCWRSLCFIFEMKHMASFCGRIYAGCRAHYIEHVPSSERVCSLSDHFDRIDP